MIVVNSPEEVVQAIREQMEENRRFQILLAHHLGISQKHLSQMMTGKANLSLHHLFRILEYLDMKMVLMVMR